MEARIVDLETLFNTHVSYRIPQFQRPYAWRKGKQWEPLWDDVLRNCKRLLNSEYGDQVPPHFMGAIVLQPIGHSTGEVAKSLVVDGQQRLTTLQLLLRAAHEAFQGVNETARATRLSQLLLNGENYWGDDPDNETKIRQSNQNDQKAFQEAIRGVSDEHGPTRSINEAHQFFKSQVECWLNENPTERVNRARVLEETLSKNLQIAAIDLDEREKPHFIFGVLNTRAETLAQCDLVKNTVMYEANVIDDVQAARSLWGMFDSNDWWRKETKEGRLTRIHLDRFLNYWMVMRAKNDVTAERVSGEFTNYVESARPSQTIHEIAEDVRKAGVVYADIEHARIPGIEVVLRRMKTLEIGVVVPPLLWLYTNEMRDEIRLNSVRALESYLVRRMLYGLGSQGLNRLFIELLTNLENARSDTADEVIINFLKKQSVDNRLWPRDDMLTDRLISEPLKGTVGRQTMILEAVELHMRGTMTEDFVAKALTREHIMPKSWHRNWSLTSDVADAEDARARREEAVKTIGNLTLTTSKLNSSLSNSAWVDKQETLRQYTSLRLNWELLHDAPDVWDEYSIRERSKVLAGIIREIWPFADQLLSQ